MCYRRATSRPFDGILILSRTSVVLPLTVFVSTWDFRSYYVTSTLLYDFNFVHTAFSSTASGLYFTQFCTRDLIRTPIDTSYDPVSRTFLRDLHVP